MGLGGSGWDACSLLPACSVALHGVTGVLWSFGIAASATAATLSITQLWTQLERALGLPPLLPVRT